MGVGLSTTILALAWFAAINAAVSLLAWVVSLLIQDSVVPSARRSRLLLVVRFLPFLASAIVAFVLFVPAHLRLEPPNADERYGVLPFVLAAAGLGLLTRSACLLASVLITARRLGLSARAHADTIAGSAEWIELPQLQGVALAGVFRPRLLIGTDARRVLTDAELEVAVAHERAHYQVQDNLTRVLMACVPDLLSFTPAARRIEALWNGQAECLADARAARGSAERATLLASALLKIARLRSAPIDCPAWSPFHQPALLETRVRLLVASGPIGQRASNLRSPVLLGVACVAAATILGWSAGLPGALHHVTEVLLARLS